MTGYEQKIGLLKEASGQHPRTARWRMILATVLFGIVVLALIFGILEYRQKAPAIPVPTPTCCALPINPPLPPSRPDR